MQNFLTSNSNNSVTLISTELGHQSYFLGKNDSEFVRSVINLFMGLVPNMKHRFMNEMMLCQYRGATTVERLKFMEEKVLPFASVSYLRELRAELESKTSRLIRTNPFGDDGNEIHGVEVVGSYAVRTGEIIATIVDTWVDGACRQLNVDYVVNGSNKDTTIDRQLDSLGESELAAEVRVGIKKMVSQFVDNHNPKFVDEMTVFKGASRLAFALSLFRRPEKFEELLQMLTSEERAAYDLLETLVKGDVLVERLKAAENAEQASETTETQVEEAGTPDILAEAAATVATPVEVTAEVVEVTVTTDAATANDGFSIDPEDGQVMSFGKITTNLILVHGVAFLNGNKVTLGDVGSVQEFIKQGGAKFDKVASTLSSSTGRKLNAEEMLRFIAKGDPIEPAQYEEVFNGFYSLMSKATQNELRKRLGELTASFRAAASTSASVDASRITREPAEAV